MGRRPHARLRRAHATAVGTEFVGTSISSDGNGAEASEDRRGYTVLDLTASELAATFRAVPFVSAPDAPIGTAARFVVTDGVPGAQPG